jgi:phosphoribosylformylglycinamidine cyclo-ligase
LENIPRVLPNNLAARLDSSSWTMPDIFKWLQTEGNIDSKEMYRVLNCGIGMVVVTSKNSSQAVIDYLKDSGENAWLVGEIVNSTGNQVVI